MCTKVLATIIITGSLIASPLFASNFFKNIPTAPTKTGSMAFKPNAPLKSKKAGNDFADFSGTWEGTCTDHEGIETITIENSESEFTVEGKTYSIGSLETESTSDKDTTYFSHLLLEWNADHSSLLFNSSFVALFYIKDFKFKNFGYQKGTISLQNDQLIFEAVSQSSDFENPKIFCTYQKQ